MKKSVFIFCLLVIGFCGAQAQTSAGSMMIGGGFGFTSTSSQGGGSSTSFSLTPSFGYFIQNNLAVGAGLQVGGGSTSSSLGLGPFARYYMSVTDNFNIYGEASLAFGITTTDVGAADVTSGFTQLRVSPGLVYFFNEHFAGEFQFALLSVRSDDPNKDVDDDRSTTFALGINTFAPTIGIRYHF